jgi:Bacterial regulatory proteins, luxR family
VTLMSREPFLHWSDMYPLSHASMIDDGRPGARGAGGGPGATGWPGGATPRVLIVSDRPLYARAIQALLESGSTGGSSRVLAHSDGPRLAPAGPEVVLFFPQDWRELAARLPGLRRQVASRPWVFLAEGRLVGMFLSLLGDQPCHLVEPDTPPAALGRLLQEIVDQPLPSLGAELLARFARGARLLRVGRRPGLPSAMVLQCGCAVSFGLRDAEIAQLFHLREATIKSHVHHLLRKLALLNRVELGEVMRRALAPHSSPGSDERLFLSPEALLPVSGRGSGGAGRSSALVSASGRDHR